MLLHKKGVIPTTGRHPVARAVQDSSRWLEGRDASDDRDDNDRVQAASNVSTINAVIAMKSLSITLSVIAVLGLLTYTNPGLDRYEQFINQEINEQTRQQGDPLSGALGSLFGGFAANWLSKQTERKDYVFFSTYDTVLGNGHLRALGVLNNFYKLEEPALTRQDRQP
jgi:hypothetical protein